MKINNLSIKKSIAITISLLFSLFLIFPVVLDLIELNYRIIIISVLGNSFIVILIVVMILDIVFLLYKKENFYFLSFLNMGLSLFLFLLMIYSFLNNIYELIYVMNYSNSTLPLIYKIVAIWAGEQGSIMTWIMFNSLIIYFYRMKNHNKEDLVFIRSVVILLIASTIFLIILLSSNPFGVKSPPVYPNGRGLNPLLISPFMIWHPFFTFIAYAIFLIPFTVTIAESITRNKKKEENGRKESSKLLNSYQQDFYNFSLKFGWLVLTLSIGLGAYWAKVALAPWNRYWGWDPVEIVSLIPWFFITAFFHTKSFQKKNPLIVKINVVLIFLSIIFSTLITRGGGLSSLHSFAGKTELIVWVVIIGALLASLSLYVIYIILDYLLEEYQKTKLFLDYLSYIILFGLAFVCVFGLLIPPFTYILSIDIIFIGTDYFIITTFTLAIILAISLIFCSLWEYFKIKWITITLIIGILIQFIISFLLYIIGGIFINPAIIIYFIALAAAFLKLLNTFDLNKGLKHFFRMNSKTIIHIGISFILIGTLINPKIELLLDFFYITGFFVLILGIVPSILMVFFQKKKKSISI